jgi:predicted enzyme related to lactoylglutathione lyase
VHFFTVSKFYKNLVKWTLTEMECSVAGTTTLDRECSDRGILEKYYSLEFSSLTIVVNSEHFIT